MPHIPDTLHDTHDLELVAAFAAGDASGDDLARATTLVAGCADCAALHHDLRAIAAAMPELPAPVRPRDFRLTPERAASLRPAGLRGLLATLAGPRFSFATPLGSGLAALGIVGVLVASGGLGAGGSAAGPAQPEAAQGQPQVEAPANQAPAASEAPAASMGIELYPPDAAASAAPSDASGGTAAVPGDGETVAGAQPDATADPLAAMPAGSPAPEASDDADRYSGLAVGSPAPGPTGLDTSAKDVAVQPQPPFLAPAVALALAGLVLVAVRWWARRVA